MSDQNIMFEKSLWSPSIPCKNFKVRQNTKIVSIPENVHFQKIGSTIGCFYYPNDNNSPVFSNPYFKQDCSKIADQFIIYAPARVDLELTYLCNLKCQHCYVQAPDSSCMDLKHVKKLLRDFQKMGVAGIQLLGGEVSLYPNITEVIMFAKSCNLKIEIVSNGSESLIKNCLPISNLIDVLFISIDGTQSTHDQLRGSKGSFKSAINALWAFSQKGVKTKAVCTLNNRNKTEICQLANIIKETNADGLVFKFMLPIGKGQENCDLVIPKNERKIIREKIQKMNSSFMDDRLYPAFNDEGQFSFFGCPGGRFTVRISPKGDVYWCIYSDEILGNVYKKSFKSIWSKITKRNFYGDNNCPHSLRCGGPCKLSSKYRPGKLYCSETNICFPKCV